MLGQSKTAHQAEIDAACELIDFLRFNVEFMTRIYAEQPLSAPGVWNRLEYRPLEGFVFAVSPFNFTAIAGNLPSSAALMGNIVVWKPASTAMLSAYYLMRLFQAAGLPDGVINLVYGSGATIGDAALARPDLAGIHFTGSTARLQRDVEDGRRATSAATATIRASSARPAARTSSSPTPPPTSSALAAAIVRGAFEYQGQKCSAASRVYVPSNLWPALRERLAEEVAIDPGRRRRRLQQLHGRGDRRRRVRDPAARHRGGTRPSRAPRSSSAAVATTRPATSSSRR